MGSRTGRVYKLGYVVGVCEQVMSADYKTPDMYTVPQTKEAGSRMLHSCIAEFL